MTRIKEIREAVANPTGEASLGLLFRHLSASRLVTIAQVEGRVRGAGREFVLACDMRFAARESAIFGQPEVGFGLIPGSGAVQHLTRLMGRGRALEVLLTVEDYDGLAAERYGWINRALPAAALGDFVKSLARRIASFPASGLAVIKERVNSVALVPAEDFCRDSNLFLDCARIQAAMRRGFQTRVVPRLCWRQQTRRRTPRHRPVGWAINFPPFPAQSQKRKQLKGRPNTAKRALLRRLRAH